jgi:predicted transcriptional regulator
LKLLSILQCTAVINVIMESYFLTVIGYKMLDYLKQNIGSIAEKDFAHIGEDRTVTEAAKEMHDKDTTSLIITKKNSSEPISIVTERYLVSCIGGE